MPTNQPSNAPDDAPQAARDDRSAAAVIADETLDMPAGGGGLGGASAAGDTLHGAGGAAPNAPIDAPTPDAGDAKAQREAATRAAAADAPEPYPASR